VTLNRIAKTLLLVLILLGTATVYLHRDNYDVEEMTQWVETHPYIAPFLFVLTYTLLTALLFPSPLLCLSGGVLFGPVPGILLNLGSATLSAITTFAIGRYLAADWLEKRLEGELRDIKHGVERKGWRFVLMLRLIPGLPFTLFNYALGLTRIHLLQFAGVTALCILPRVIFLTYVGYTGQRALAGEEIGVWPVLVMLVAGTLIAAGYLTKRLKTKPLV
jgi:uncharacterized membrane protein YdjX (TVP38/TMEM64 family)